MKWRGIITKLFRERQHDKRKRQLGLAAWKKFSKKCWQTQDSVIWYQGCLVRAALKKQNKDLNQPVQKSFEKSVDKRETVWYNKDLLWEQQTDLENWTTFSLQDKPLNEFDVS